MKKICSNAYVIKLLTDLHISPNVSDLYSFEGFNGDVAEILDQKQIRLRLSKIS